MPDILDYNLKNLRNVGKIQGDIYELKHNIYRIYVSTPISKNEEITLDFNYIVGQLEVKYCGHDLIRGTVENTEEDGEYAEVGEEGSISNKIMVGFDIPVSTSYPRYFDFIVKGGVDNAN